MKALIRTWERRRHHTEHLVERPLLGPNDVAKARVSPNAVALGPGGARRGHVDDDAAAHGGLGSCQAWRDVVLKPGADQLGDAVQVLWLLVPQDADRPPLLGQDILEAAEPRVLCGLGRKSVRSSSNSTSSTGSRSVMSMIEACTTSSFVPGTAIDAVQRAVASMLCSAVACWRSARPDLIATVGVVVAPTGVSRTR